MTAVLAAVAIAYLFVGAELAAYTRGFDEGQPSAEQSGAGDLVFIVLAWPVVLIAGVWRDWHSENDE